MSARPKFRATPSMIIERMWRTLDTASDQIAELVRQFMKAQKGTARFACLREQAKDAWAVWC
jgi:hypothetical protein